MRLGGYFFTFRAVSCPSDCRDYTDFFNNEYSEYDEFIQCTMHLKLQRIKTNVECSHSIPFVAACGIRDIHLLAAW